MDILCYTGFFDVVEYEDYFTVNGLYSIKTILVERHNGAEVEIPESVPEHAEFFIMTVKSTTQDSKHKLLSNFKENKTKTPSDF